MFKKEIVLSIIILISNNSFAITDQIEHAHNFLNQENIQILKKEILLKGTGEDGIFSNEIYYKNINKDPLYTAVSPTKDISLKSNKFNPLLKEFQENNSLEATGVVNKETIDFVNGKQDEFGLNVTNFLDPNTWFISYNQPIRWQIKTVQDSLVEWNKVLEKQKQNNTDKFIVVTLPNMRLTAYNWDSSTHTAQEEFATRVVIGTRSHQTPLDDMFIWGLKYNPNWTPTTNIIKRNLLKNGEINQNWLSKNKLRAINENGEIVTNEDINLDNYRSLRFVQPSGGDNALGLLKFETNSKDNIYLHDTNAKHLFGYNSRNQSSGCVRVDDYLVLASWLAEKDEDSITNRIKKGEMIIISTPKKIPVYTIYTQAYFDDPIPAFAPDVYRKHKGIIYKQ